MNSLTDDKNEIEDLEFIKLYYIKQEEKRKKLNQFYRDKYKNNEEYRKYKKDKNRENYLRRKNINNNNNAKQISV